MIEIIKVTAKSKELISTGPSSFDVYLTHGADFLSLIDFAFHGLNVTQASVVLNTFAIPLVPGADGLWHPDDKYPKLLPTGTSSYVDECLWAPTTVFYSNITLHIEYENMGENPEVDYCYVNNNDHEVEIETNARYGIHLLQRTLLKPL